MTTISKSKLRSRKRGAALVEAAVIMPVVVMFFGLITFAYRDLTTKQDIMLVSKHKAFQNSLRSCPSGSSGGGGGFGGQVGGAANSGGEQGQVAIAGGKLLSVLTAGFSATTMSESKTAHNSPLSSIIRSRARTATSYVYCSPESGFLDGMLGIVKSLMNMAASLVGL